MALNPVARNLGFIAAYLGMVQGLAWFGMSLFNILLYTNLVEPQFPTQPKYGSILSQMIYTMYSYNSKLQPTDIYITATQLFRWSIAYEALSLGWFMISCVMFYHLFHDKNRQLQKNFLVWGITTEVISICDVVLVSLIAWDYDYLVTEINKTVMGPLTGTVTYGILSVGIMMTIVARGYVLWVINTALAIYLIKTALTWPKQTTVNGGQNTIHAFGQNSNTSPGTVNPAFKMDGDKPNDYRTNPLLNNPLTLPRLPPISSTNERLAKIGKQMRSGRSSPTNVSPPRLPTSYIYPTQPRVPNPDYSPPSSPQLPLKSALKNRTQANYGDKY